MRKSSIKVFIHTVPEDFRKDPDKIYVAVVGGRDVDDKEFVKRAFDSVVSKIEKPPVIVSGGAKGVDSIARQIAEERRIEMVEIRADWNKYGKRAGILRNTAIVQVADVVVAIPGPHSRGTWDTVRKARQMNKPCFVFKYKSGEPELP